MDKGARRFLQEIVRGRERPRTRTPRERPSRRREGAGRGLGRGSEPRHPAGRIQGDESGRGGALRQTEAPGSIPSAPLGLDPFCERRRPSGSSAHCVIEERPPVAREFYPAGFRRIDQEIDDLPLVPALEGLALALSVAGNLNPTTFFKVRDNRAALPRRRGRRGARGLLAGCCEHPAMLDGF